MDSYAKGVFIRLFHRGHLTIYVYTMYSTWHFISYYYPNSRCIHPSNQHKYIPCSAIPTCSDMLDPGVWILQGHHTAECGWRGCQTSWGNRRQIQQTIWWCLLLSPLNASALEYALFLCRGRSVASPNDPGASHYAITILDQAGKVIGFECMKDLRSDNF